MIDEPCKVPRENLDDGFNPCRRQVMENGELCQYAHMYDVMNERCDREEDTRYLNSVKRDRITQTTPSQTVVEGKLYAQDAQGVDGFIKSSGTLDPTTHAEIPSSKAVADYVPIPLPISKGGTGGNTPYVTDDLDSSAIFVMHDAPNDRYDAVPMSALMNYLATLFPSLDSTRVIPEYSDLNDYINLGTYGLTSSLSAQTISNRPNIAVHGFKLFVYDTTPSPGYTSQLYLDLFGNIAQRHIDNGVWSDWNILADSSTPNPLPVDQGGTGAQTRRLKTAAGLTLIPVIDSIGASGALNGYTSVTNIATFITSNNIRPEIATAFENHTADAVAHNDLLPTNALMMDYVDGSLINYNSITVSGGGTSNIVYNRVRLKSNRIYGDCDFTVDSKGDDGGVKVNIIINGTDINIPPVFTKFMLSNKPILVHKSSNTIIEGKNIYNVSNGNVIIQFNIGDFNTGEFIFIVDSVFTGYNQPM